MHPFLSLTRVTIAHNLRSSIRSIRFLDRGPYPYIPMLLAVGVCRKLSLTVLDGALYWWRAMAWRALQYVKCTISRGSNKTLDEDVQTVMLPTTRHSGITRQCLDGEPARVAVMSTRTHAHSISVACYHCSLHFSSQSRPRALRTYNLYIALHIHVRPCDHIDINVYVFSSIYRRVSHHHDGVKRYHDMSDIGLRGIN